MASSCQITDNLVQKLSSSSIYSIKKALALVAKLTKRSNEANLFREKGGLNKLLALLKRPNNSIIDMAMSAIANCAMFDENKKEVRRLDGIQPIVSVLKNLKSMSIRNRAARALANLAEDDHNAMVIEELGAIEELVKLLDETTDSDCQQTVLRSLKILSKTQGHKKIVYEQGGVKTMVELLKSEKPVVVSCCVKAICELTKNCPKEIAQQIQEFDGIKEIIKLTNCDKPSVSFSAFMTVVNLCVHAQVRVSIACEGGIAVLHKQAELNVSSHVTLKALEGLCYFCREAVNRNRVYECGGIELLLKQLLSSEYPSLHRKIITAFTCFYYNEKCLQLLLSNGIVVALLTYLKKVISSCCSISHSEDDNDIFDHESFTSDFSSPSESPRSILFTPFDSNSDISCNDSFLEEAENLAIQVRDANESSNVLTFKRKARPRVLSASLTPTVKTIDQSPSLFSFSSLHSKTETTSMMRTCTLSSTSVTSRPAVLHSFPQGLICSTPKVEKKYDEDVLLEISTPNEYKIKDVRAPNNISTTESYYKFRIPISSNKLPTTDIVEESPAACSHKRLDFCFARNQNGKEDPITVNEKCQVEDNFSRYKAPSLLLTPPQKDKIHGNYPNFHGPGHNALLLLSRLSHMSDQTGLGYLLTKQCIKVLLDYLCLLDNPSPKCARLLNSLTSDPQCFESLVCMGIACDIHRQLCLGYTEGYIYINAEGKETQEKDMTNDKQQDTSTDDIKCEDFHPPQIYIPCNSVVRCRVIGNQLLENLSCQSQTPFGKGVLMHLMTKGSGEDWLGCVLTLPLVCRSQNSRSELMIKKQGLKMLCDMLTSVTSDQVFAKAVNSLTTLSSSIGLKICTSIEISEERYLDQNLVQTCKRKCDSNTASDETPSKCPKLNLFSTVSDSKQDALRSKDVNSCKYYNNCYGLHDIHFKVDSGQVIPAHHEILVNTSEMFAAMLSSNYIEGSMPVIPLQQVTLNALTYVIHHGYGCTLPALQEDIPESFDVCKHLQLIINSYNLDRRFQFMIEMLAIADRFLMAKLKSIIEQVLITLTRESNVVSLCLSAAHYHSNTLCEFGLKFLLLKVSDLHHQYHSFREIFQSPNKSKFIYILYKILYHQLQEKL